MPTPEVPTRATVLIVDDEVTLARAIKRVLSPDYDVFLSFSPRSALDMVRAGMRFGAIVCDLSMPEMTGEELYTAVRGIDAEQAARFVFTSGDLTRAETQRFLASVSSASIEKPFDHERLREIVAGLVR